jgi:UDP-N-acetylmuramate dehydrogenase
MPPTTFREDLQAGFPGRVREHVPLAPMTTFQIGGPADFLLEPASAEEVCGALAIAHRWNVPVTVLGGGSNVLVADRGVRGLVVRPRLVDIRPLEGGLVRAEAGVTINGLVRWTVSRGLAGLEAWAGTPGTVGGAIFGNAHFQGGLMGNHVHHVAVASRAGDQQTVPVEAMAFGYDRNRLQQSGEVLLWAAFNVSPGDPAVLRRIAHASLAFRKQTQPLQLPSAGCIFRNPGDDEPLSAEVPRSAGALIDRAGLKGCAVGGARVSPVHANFIVNEGGATAQDVRALVARCREAVLATFGIGLREEIVYVGEF